MEFECPVCGAIFDVEDVEEGDEVRCPECGALLVVVKKGKKFQLEPVPEEEEEEWEEEEEEWEEEEWEEEEEF
ncbi:MAG: hypothetical protein NZ992_05380 [Candidatus Korarchaeum sp.]|nr:hypothetical protein [Candidatus Korarchaeum sp.]